MESSIQESGEGSGLDESIRQSMESEIKICGEEIALFKSVSKKSKKWYRDYGFEGSTTPTLWQENGRGVPQSAGRYV